MDFSIQRNVLMSVPEMLDSRAAVPDQMCLSHW